MPTAEILCTAAAFKPAALAGHLGRHVSLPGGAGVLDCLLVLAWGQSRLARGLDRQATHPLLNHQAWHSFKSA